MIQENSASKPQATEERVRALAELAALPLDPSRVAALTVALDADLRLITPLRSVDVGAVAPPHAAPAHEG